MSNCFRCVYERTCGRPEHAFGPDEDYPDFKKAPKKCGGCLLPKKDVRPRYSFGYYAGEYCEKCAYDKYRDHCGLKGQQGRAEDLDEFQAGGYDAVHGEVK